MAILSLHRVSKSTFHTVFILNASFYRLALFTWLVIDRGHISHRSLDNKSHKKYISNKIIDRLQKDEE